MYPDTVALVSALHCAGAFTGKSSSKKLFLGVTNCTAASFACMPGAGYQKPYLMPSIAFVLLYPLSPNCWPTPTVSHARGREATGHGNHITQVAEERRLSGGFALARFSARGHGFYDKGRRCKSLSKPETVGRPCSPPGCPPPFQHCTGVFPDTARAAIVHHDIPFTACRTDVDPQYLFAFPFCVPRPYSVGWQGRPRFRAFARGNSTAAVCPSQPASVLSDSTTALQGIYFLLAVQRKMVHGFRRQVSIGNIS
ncbi:Uncharacterised protein [Cedecea neteri]|uniref:Uncharacterized protein n=1 Tax=Cedecea neteri TaxID=158822 RepID=A0A2X3J7I4_9ENTR|nr:Uncharacterised protein [Cedecea neteri]